MYPSKDALADFIVVLRDSLSNCHRAEDRDKYKRHLAQAAIMLAETYQGRPISGLMETIEQEKRSFGWDYLSNAEGEAAESAFARLVNLIEKKAGTIK